MSKFLFALPLLLFFAVCTITSNAADEVVRLPLADKVTVIPCFFRQGNHFSTAENIAEKNLGNGINLVRAFLEEFKEGISVAGYRVELMIEDVCPIKDGMVEPEGITVVVIVNALGAAFRDDVIAIRGHLKIPGQPKLLSGQGEWLNGIKGIGPREASHKIVAKLVKQIREAQKKSDL